MMRKFKVIMCTLDYGKLNQDPIFDLKVTKSQDFSDLKTKIECKSQFNMQEVLCQKKYDNIEYDQLFYVCQEKILKDNDQMIQFQNEELEIRIYELTSIYKQFQDQINDIETMKSQISKELNDKAELEKINTQLHYKINELESQLLLEQQNIETQKVNDEEQRKQLIQQNSTKEEQHKREKQNFLLKLQTLNNEILQFKKNEYNLQKQIDSVEDKYSLLFGQYQLIEDYNKDLQKKISVYSVIHPHPNWAQLQNDYDSMKVNYKNEQKLNQQKQTNIDSLLKKLNESDAKYCQEQYQNKILQDQNELDKAKIQNLTKQIDQIQAQVKETQSEKEKQLSQEKQNNRDKQAQIQNLQNEINQLKNKVDQKEKEIQNIQQDLENRQQSLIQFKKRQEGQIGQLTGKEQQLTQEKLQMELQLENKIKRQETEITNLQGKLEESEKNLRKIQKQLADQNSTLNSEHSEFQDQINKEKEFKGILQAKLNRLSDKFKEVTNRAKIFDCKIVSPTEKLFQNQQDVNNFDSGANAINNDNIFEVSLLSIDPKKMEKLLQKGDLGITEAIQQQNLGNWTTKKSMNPSAQGTKRNLYLVRIVSEPSNKLNGKIFAMKELPNIANTKVEQAYEVASNSLISQYLLEHFKNAFKGHIDHKINIPNINFQEQYLFTCEGKFFIAEPLYPDGTFKKYNGAGDSNDKDRNIQMFLNAFSFYSYNFSQKQFIITNLQGIGDKLYDPIISTNEGVFMEEDLGQDEITKMLQNYKYDQKVNGKQYLGILGIKI